jgi:hypothetical protein
MHLPSDEQEVYIWIAALTAAYLVVAYCIQYTVKGFSWQDSNQLTRVFDATSFAGSIMLLIGMFAPSVLTAIGSTNLRDSI